MGLYKLETLLVLLFTMFFLSFGLNDLIIKGEEMIGRKEWLRSEQEMSWLFEEWIVKHDKTYNDVEEKEKRFIIFKDNMLFIDEHNRPENNHSYTVGVNQFADLTDEEFRSKYLSFSINTSVELSPPITNRYKVKKGQRLPNNIDWRNEGAVSDVKNQGICESCRAFSTVAAIEGLYKINTGDLITLSEQELIDCDKVNKGCQPGYIYHTYKYVENNGGIDADWHYPYQGVEDICRPDRVTVVSISSFEKVQSNNEYALQSAVAHQPVSVSVEAHGRNFRFHKSGVFTGPCGTATDHFITVIGYGTDYNGVDYWLVKNSWGRNWGVDGIGMIQRNVGGAGMCGILSYSLYPVMDTWPSNANNKKSNANNKKSNV